MSSTNGRAKPRRAKTGTEQLPPHSTEAEKGVIGAVLRDNAVLSDILAIVRPDHFYFDAHQKIFQAIIDLYNDGKPVDTVILFETLKRRKQLEDTGGAEYLAELWDSAPTAANCRYHAGIVRNKFIQRSLIHASTEIARDASDDVQPGGELLDRLRLRLDQLTATGPGQAFDRTWKYQPVAFRDFMAADYRREWLVKGVLVRGQPAMVAGPQKSLKTSAIADLTVSLTTATPFLGRFSVPQPLRVELFSGESGEATLQETFRQITRARGLSDFDLPIALHTRLPQLGKPADLATFARGLAASRPDVVVIEPVYLCLLAGLSGTVNESSLMQMGPLLATVNEVVADLGGTLVLGHHSTKRIPLGQPLELTDMAFAGFSEFARQWMLINREEKYLGDGHHRLIFSIGGSAKHSGLYAVHIDEGTIDDQFEGGRWDVEIRGWTESQVAEQADRAAERESKARRKMEAEWKKVFDAIDSRTNAGEEAATMTNIRTHAAFSSDTARRLVNELVEQGDIEAIEFTKRTGNRTPMTVTGYRRCSR